MDSDDEAEVYRHDIDSGDEYLVENDDSSSSSESESDEPVDRSRSRPTQDIVDSGGDRTDQPGPSRTESGRGPRQNQWAWKLLRDPETGNPKAWLMEFDHDSAGVNRSIVDRRDELKTPVDFFRLLFPDVALELIRDETNRYAAQVLQDKELTPHSRKKKWSPVDNEDINAFIGLQIGMGMCKKGAEVDHWRKLFWLNETPYGKVMSRNRYQLISSFLHFSDNNEYIPRGQDGYDALFKIRKLMDLLEPLYLHFYSPSMQLSIDESMVGFKGRIHFLQFMPAKPTRFGLKLFALVESKTHYLLKFIVYTGKDTFVTNTNESLPETVVTRLLEGFEQKGHIVYFDNWYTSMKLIQDLSADQTGAVGTILENRKNFPDSLKKKNRKLKKGDPPVFARHGKLLTSTWHDSKRVNLVSSVHNNDVIEKRKRSKADPSGFVTLQKPLCVEDYNNFMGGVDQFDQVAGYYSYPYKCSKWYLTLYHFLIETCLVNSHILLKQIYPGKKITSKRFREEVAISLLKEQIARRQAQKLPQTVADLPSSARMFAPHYPSQYEDAKYKPSCKVCASIKTRRQTRFFCKECGVPLCVFPCHGIYHSKEDFAVARQQCEPNVYSKKRKRE